MKAYVDAAVLIWHLRAEPRALRFIRGLRDDPNWELWTGAMQRVEVLLYIRPPQETETLLFLSLFHTAPVDQAIVDKAASLFRQWNPSHGVDVDDAILAATAMETGGTIFTLKSQALSHAGVAGQEGLVTALRVRRATQRNDWRVA